MEKDFANNKSLTELKEKFKKELQSHPAGKNKTLKWLLKNADHYTYARWTQNYSYKSNSLETPWVQKALAEGVTETELIANADKMRENTWLRIQRNKAKLRKLKNSDEPRIKEMGVKTKGTDATKVRGIG